MIGAQFLRGAYGLLFCRTLPCGEAVGFAVFGWAIRGGAPLLQMSGVYAFV